MASTRADLLLHPVRLRILQAVAQGARLERRTDWRAHVRCPAGHPGRPIEHAERVLALPRHDRAHLGHERSRWLHSPARLAAPAAARDDSAGAKGAQQIHAINPARNSRLVPANPLRHLARHGLLLHHACRTVAARARNRRETPGPTKRATRATVEQPDVAVNQRGEPYRFRLDARCAPDSRFICTRGPLDRGVGASPGRLLWPR
jgi:hypothetical protein